MLLTPSVMRNLTGTVDVRVGDNRGQGNNGKNRR